MRNARIVIFAGLLAALSPLFAFAQKHPSVELGFNAERLYQFGNLDSVNLYNGNLILQLPIGPAYSVNALKYQFVLTYNSKVWDYERYTPSYPEDSREYLLAFPNWRSNAGVGWRLSFGRLLPPNEGNSWWNDDRFWKYEDASGNEHAFGPSDRNDTGYADHNNDVVLLSRDQAAIRMVRESANVRRLEFPSGEMHRFEFDHGRWRLRKIYDRFGNYVRIDSSWDDAEILETAWTVTDSEGRTHTVTFHNFPYTSDSIDRGQHVSSISLASAAGVDPDDPNSMNGADVTYTFDVQPTVVEMGCQNDPLPDGDPTDDHQMEAPLLRAIGLPDGSSFQFTYYVDQSGGFCSQAALESMTLPTKGKVRYLYQQMMLPESFCQEAQYPNANPGVMKKFVIADPVSSMSEAVTDYIYSLSPQVDYNRAQACESCGCFTEVPGGPPSPKPQPLYRWARTSVLSPAVDGTRIRNDSYFYTWNTDIFTDDFNPAQPDGSSDRVVSFGQSMTTGAPSDANALVGAADADASTTTNDGQKHFLSTRTFEKCPNSTSLNCAGGRLLRSTHLRYMDHDLADRSIPYYPVESTITKYHDDNLTGGDSSWGCGGACWVRTANSLADGIHQFSKSVTTTNLPEGGGVTVTTNHPVWTLGMVGAVDQQSVPLHQWLLDTYDRVERTENTKTAISEFCFDGTTGYLKGIRLRADSDTRQANDIVTLFSGARGNVEREESYTGAAEETPGAAACAPTGMSLDYLTKNTFAHGVFVQSEACDPATSGSGCTSILTPQHIDAHRTGVPTASYDASDLKTKYAYDFAGRLSKVKPNDHEFATSIYDYTNATAANRAKVKETVKTTTGVNATGTTIKETTYEFDGLGRLMRVTTSLPQNKQAAVETTYDDLGRKSDVTQPFDPATSGSRPSTHTKYDALGRPIEVTGPDSKKVTFEYAGDHLMRRTTPIAMPPSGAEVNARVTEHYDAQHRLRRVIENSNDTSASTPVGGAVQTVYAYDVGGRLTGVTTLGGPSQSPRSFTYDLRGFLTEESHPESATSYSDYDARGHAGKKKWMDATSTLQTLTLEYDGAERLTKVSDGTKVLKKFDFATANTGPNGVNRQKGKLVTAYRRNDLPSAGQIDVTESYAYEAPNGQMSKRTTLVEQVNGTNRSPIQQSEYEMSYDQLGQPMAITKMPTCPACPASGQLAGVTFEREAGYLEGVAGFASLTYDPSGMVHSVEHLGTTPGTDTYEAQFGLPRPYIITLAGVATPAACATPVINAPETICAGGTATASVATVAGATYAWTIQGGTISSPANGTTITFQATDPSQVQLSVEIHASCGVANDTHTIAVSAAPSASIISAPTAVCANSSGHDASVPVRAGITHAWTIAGGTFTLPNGQTGTATTGETVTFNAGASTVTLSVTATSSCGGSTPSSRTVQITARPTAILSIDGSPDPRVTIVRGANTIVPLRVDLTGVGPWEIAWRGGPTETVSTNPYIRNVSPDGRVTEYAIDSVKAGNCMTDVSDITGGVSVYVVPPAPAWVTASTRPDGKVEIRWADVPGAVSYRIERRTLYSSGGFDYSPTTVNPYVESFPSQAGLVTYVYYVLAKDSLGAFSLFGAYDYVTGGTPLWSQTITPHVTPVKGQDVQELRKTVDSVRAALGFSPAFGGTTPPSGIVTATNLNAIVTALNQARTARGFPPFVYNNVAPPAPGGNILAEHILQLRKAVD